jgi:uncharacterized protein YacL (UPF0231 family)
MDNNSEVKQLLIIEKELYEKYYDYKNRMNKILDEIKIIDDKIMKSCDHKWEADHSYYDHQTVLICHKCNRNR